MPAADETRTPKPSEMAMGTMDLACTLWVNMSGVSPDMVVTVVIRIGRNRDTAALTRASGIESPDARNRFTP